MGTRLGILGFAHGHVGMYCGQWRQMPAENVQVLAGWDHDAARLADAVAKHGVAPQATAQSLVDRADIDAVIIGAETSRHAELVELAAAAGKAIILQKPMALTLEQADRIVAAVDRAGVKFSLAWQMRVDPQNLKMRQLMKDGTLGRVYMVRRRHCLPTNRWPWFETSWHVQPELNRGMWADDASHPIDLLYWMLGEPISVIAEIDTLRNPKVPDDNGMAIFRYADGTFAEIVSSFVCVAGENTTEIIGEKGVAIQNYGDLVTCGNPRPPGAIGLKWFLEAEGRWIDSEIPSPPSHGVRISALAGPILDYLQDRRSAIATAAEGRAALRMTLACYRSAQEGRRVRIADVTD